MKRSLQDWANLAEITGTLAIICSLLFVGLQISDNTRQMRSAAAHNATDSLQNWYVEIATNPEAANVFRRGMSEPGALSKDEAFIFLMNIYSVMLGYQNVYFLGAEGTLDESLSIVLTATMVSVIPTRGFQWYWDQRNSFFTAEFHGVVEGLMVGGVGGGGEIYQ